MVMQELLIQALAEVQQVLLMEPKLHLVQVVLD
jgi:hypothetical protein